MRALCGDGRDVSCSTVGSGSERDLGSVMGPRGVLEVGPLSMNSVITAETFFGVTFSMILNAGSRRIVVGSE